MTNKLPVVGKRYKAKHNNKIFTAVTYLGADLDVSVRMCCNNDLLSDFTYRPKNDNFDKFFEELPEDEAETKPETQSLELSPEVKEAMEELKKESLHIPFGDLKDYHYNKLKQDAETLLNALDKQFSKTPNEETLKSFSDYENKDGLTKYDSVEELFDDLEGKNS